MNDQGIVSPVIADIRAGRNNGDGGKMGQPSHFSSALVAGYSAERGKLIAQENGYQLLEDIETWYYRGVPKSPPD